MKNDPLKKLNDFLANTRRYYDDDGYPLKESVSSRLVDMLYADETFMKNARKNLDWEGKAYIKKHYTGAKEDIPTILKDYVAVVNTTKSVTDIEKKLTKFYKKYKKDGLSFDGFMEYSS